MAERALIINLPEIKPTDRMAESEFWRDFERDRTAIFAGLLDCLVSGLAHRDSVVLKEKPRMADVAIWVTACEKAINPAIAFIDAHTKNQREAIELGIEASPVGTAIKDLMADRDKWTGTPTHLLRELETIVGTNQTKSRAWPQSTKGFKNSIKRLMPNFRKIGIFITVGKSGDRFYKIIKVPEQAPEASKAPKPTDGAAYSRTDVRTDSEPWTDNRPDWADSNPKCPPANPATAQVWADRTDRTLKNDLSIFIDEGEI